MNKRDYVLQALRHEKGDIVPMNIELTVDVYNAYSDRLLADYATKDIMDDYNSGYIHRNDAVNLAIGNFITLAPFPWWDWDWSRRPAEWSDPEAVPEKIAPINRWGDFDECFARAKDLKERYGTYIGAFIWGSHWEKANALRGIENMLADMAGEPEFAQRLFDFIIDTNMPYLEKMVTCPDYDGILLGSDWGTQRGLIMSQEMWRRMIAPGEMREYKVVKGAGKDLFLHSCGDIEKLLPELCDMGINVLNPVQPECMSLEHLKKTYGDRLSFWGGISTQTVLPYGTPAEVRKETERVIKLMSENGGYITCASQGIQLDVPYENLRALIDTAREYAGL